MVVVATLALAMLGIGILSAGSLEMAAARDGAEARQAACAAEAGLSLVKCWFDSPGGGAGAPIVPGAAEVDRSLRRVDPDGDGVFEPYVSAPAPWNVVYRQGRDDLFERPYGGGSALALEGDARGPDVLITADARNPAESDFLVRAGRTLFGEDARITLRLTRIAIYAPPTILSEGRRVRTGLATIEVTASVVRATAEGAETVATAQASGVIQEIPYGAPGPLSTRGSIVAGAGLDLRWGRAASAGDADLGPSPAAVTAGGWPWLTLDRRLVADADSDGTPDDSDHDGAGDLSEWLALPDASLADPWFGLVAGGDIRFAPAGVPHPYPFDPGAIPGAYVTDDDRSALFQRVAGVTPPFAPDAPLLRAAARGGGPLCHLFRYVPGTTPPLFREGTNGPVGFEAATGGREGLFYFDTTDGLPPRDAGADGTLDNLTPPILVSDPGWSASGCIVVNAESLSIAPSSRAEWADVTPPGEPFDDVDRDGTCDPGETFLGLDYPPDPLAGAGFSRRGVFPCGGGVARRIEGPAVSMPVTFAGLLLTTGRLQGQGGVRIFGAVASAGDVARAVVSGPSGDRFQILYDHRMGAGAWPPAASRLPRTVWQRRSVSP